MTNKNAEPLLPVELGAGKVKFAQGIKAQFVGVDGLAEGGNLIPRALCRFKCGNGGGQIA